MVTRPLELIPDRAKQLLNNLSGKLCTLQRIGNDRSLFIGFGVVDTTMTKPHGEIEFGTYDCAWRVCRNNKVLCGRNDAVDAVSELNECFSKVALGKFVRILQLSEFDVRLEFSSGVCVDVMCTISDDDEIIHFFFPDEEVLTFQPAEGWRFDKSDKPWT